MSVEEALPHLPRLRRYARLLTGDAARADDLVQDTLERAARKWLLWRPTRGEFVDAQDRAGSLRAWLLTLMHNLFLNQLRDRREHLHEEFAPERDPSHERSHEPHRQLQTRLDLEKALACLSPPAREVLLLVCVEELSYEQAALVLGVPVGTVMSRLSRARERLRMLMDGQGATTPLRVVK
jgi:RNA polymerase sigma-70 factor, ECF subfamily